LQINKACALVSLILLVGFGFVGVANAQVINEYVRDHTGTDVDEYVEIFGDPSTDYSSYTVIEIEGEGTGKGLIDEAFAVGTTDANGIFLISIDPADSLENGTNTLLLVQDFTGVEGDDIDTDDDGIIDVTFWSSVADGIAIEDGSNPGDDTFYSAVILTPDFDGGIFDVGGASRIPDGFDTDTPSDFVRNDFDGAGLPCCDPGTPEEGEALNTPGLANEIILPDGTILSITGSCPGTVEICTTNGSPDGLAAILFSLSMGSDAILGGPCAGVETELSNPQLQTLLTFNEVGEFCITRIIPAAACGRFLQILDAATCELSNSAQLP